MPKFSVLAVVPLLVVASALIVGSVNLTPAGAADHLDGPNASADGRTDIGDM